MTSSCHAPDRSRRGGYPNGTIGCSDPDHKLGEQPTPGLSRDERITFAVDHWPPLTGEQLGTLAVLLSPDGTDA